jgi:beta-phosphoglucomutase family hydrolase
MQYDIKPNIKGLIFDLDGTLADTMPYHFKGWRIACKKFGADIDKDFLKRLTGTPGWIIAREIIKSCNLNGSVSVDEMVEEKLYHFAKEQHNIKPILPVVDIVRKYYKILPMAVGTGGQRKVIKRTLEVTGLSQYFDITVTADDVSNYKPHPETFLKCAELMKIAPGDIEVFEDGELGLEAARTAGMIATDVRSWYNSNW